MPTDPLVDAWLTGLNHPQAEVIAAVRQLVLGADPRVSEGIKWNAGSFRHRDWFATFRVVGPKGPCAPQLVLHRGAKPQPDAPRPDDPAGLLRWQGPDRAMITFADLAAVEAQAGPLQRLVGAWLDGMPEAS
ncbi:MAG: hypothetical protein RIT28_1602 [Pseudomonadota bacterium]